MKNLIGYEWKDAENRSNNRGCKPGYSRID